MASALPPVLGLAGWSGAGKTSLLTRLIPTLKNEGVRIGVIKHAHHRFDVDQAGKDSYRIRQAGADQTLVASNRRLALMVERDSDIEPTLEELLSWLTPEPLDLILVEGFRHLGFSKIEIHRPELGKPLLFPNDDCIVAVACTERVETPLPVLNLDDAGGIAAFIRERFLEKA